MEAFSDGVFAVAVTLLVLNLRDPGGTEGLTHRLLSLWPNYTAYAVSFLVIGTIWVDHHDTFARVRYADRGLLFLNLIFLMTVVLIPFPTTVLAEHLRLKQEAHAAATTYGMVLTLVGLTTTSSWVRVARHPICSVRPTAPATHGSGSNDRPLASACTARRRSSAWSVPPPGWR